MKNTVSRIVDLMVRGKLSAGMRLTEQSLMADLKISRSVVREMLQWLSGSGLARRCATDSGYLMLSFDPGQLQQIVHLLASIEGKAARTLVCLRTTLVSNPSLPEGVLQVVEGEAAKSLAVFFAEGVGCAAKSLQRGLDKLRELYHDLETIRKETNGQPREPNNKALTAFVMADIAFHAALFSAAGLEVWEGIDTNLWLRLRLAAGNLADPASLRIAQEGHQSILAALERGSEEEAFQAVSRHCRDSVRERYADFPTSALDLVSVPL